MSNTIVASPSFMLLDDFEAMPGSAFAHAPGLGSCTYGGGGSCSGGSATTATESTQSADQA